MQDSHADHGQDAEAELIAMLAGLKMEATPEADFEGRFLYDFHEHIAQEAVCRPARKLLWEHLLQRLNNIGGRKIAYSASTLGLGALAVGFFAFPSASKDSSLATAAANVSSGLERSMANLKPGVAKEFTCISVGEKKSRSYTQEKLAAQGQLRFFGQHDAYSQEESEALPINMGLSTESGSAFPSWSTSLLN